MEHRMIRHKENYIAPLIILVIGLLLNACASSKGRVHKEVIGGVTITYLTGKPQKLGEQQERQAEYPDVYIVQKGDSIFSIAGKYGLDYKKLAAANDLGGNFVISPGQELIIGDGKAKSTKKTNNKKSKSEKSKSKKNKFDKKQQNKKQGNKKLAAKSKSPIAVAPPASKESVGFIDSAPPPLAKGGWLWPFRGRPNHESVDGRQGVHVLAPYGAIVRAANNGKVIYVGEELKQYGKLILISHSNGYLSVYADNSDILIGNDEEVKKGQEIAISGNAYGKGRIYFELRKGSTAINPVDIILNKK